MSKKISNSSNKSTKKNNSSNSKNNFNMNINDSSKIISSSNFNTDSDFPISRPLKLERSKYVGRPNLPIDPSPYRFTYHPEDPYRQSYPSENYPLPLKRVPLGRHVTDVGRSKPTSREEYLFQTQSYNRKAKDRGATIIPEINNYFSDEKIMERENNLDVDYPVLKSRPLTSSLARHITVGSEPKTRQVRNAYYRKANMTGSVRPDFNIHENNNNQSMHEINREEILKLIENNNNKIDNLLSNNERLESMIGNEENPKYLKNQMRTLSKRRPFQFPPRNENLNFMNENNNEIENNLKNSKPIHKKVKDNSSSKNKSSNNSSTINKKNKST